MPIFRLFLPSVRSNLLTANFILLRLPYFESITTYCLLQIVVQSLLLSFLISLLLLTQLGHQILLDRLASFYGFSDSALSLLTFSRFNRIHHVVVQSSSSPPL